MKINPCYLFGFEFAIQGNDVSAMVPEMWAQEGLVRLEKKLILGSFVNRDYNDEVADAGDVVNVHRAHNMIAKRLPKGAAVASNDITPTGDTVKLNQHLYQRFELSDRDRKSAFGSLVQKFLEPAISSIAQKVEACLHGEALNFFRTVSGKIGTDPDYNSLVDLNVGMNNNLCPTEGRILNINAYSEGALLKTDKLTEYRMTGDGSPIMNGFLRAGSGFILGMGQNVPDLSKTINSSDKITGAVNFSAGYAKGQTVLVVDGITGALTAGSWCLIAGDMTPQLITARTLTTGDTTGITIYPGLRSAVVNDAVITVNKPAAVNFGAGYAADYDSYITIDGLTAMPAVGQGISIGTVGASVKLFSIIEVVGSTILLNQSLPADIADGAVIGIMPPGGYNPALTRDAITLVNRPLDLVMDGAGAKSAIASYNDLSLRVTISWDSVYLKHYFLIDTLIGTKTLNPDQGALLFN